MFSELSLYLSVPQVSCFDGDDPAADPAAAAADAADATAAAAADATAAAAKSAADATAAAAAAAAKSAGDDEGKTFSTNDVNRIVQERLDRDRKSREAQHKTEYQDLETRYSELLATENLGEEQRSKLNEQLEDVRKKNRTKDQQAAHERKQLTDDYDTKLQVATKAAVIWENRFRESSINRALQDAASKNDAYSNDQVLAILRPMTKLVEVIDEITNEPTGDYNTVIDFPDVDEKGVQIVTQRTPDETVKRMKDIPEHQNLFKSNVVSGVGAHPATGGISSGTNGRIDCRNITPEQYKKIRDENPAALGL
jgi:uncharacterized membrane protein